MDQEEEFDLDAAIEAVAETMDVSAENPLGDAEVAPVGRDVAEPGSDYDGPDWGGMSDEEFAAALKERQALQDLGDSEEDVSNDGDSGLAGLTNAEVDLAVAPDVDEDVLLAELDAADRQQAEAERARRLQAARAHAATLRERIDAALRAKVDGGPRTHQEAQELAESQTSMARLSDEQFQRLLAARDAGVAGMGEAVDEAGLAVLYKSIQPREAE
jgi:hypothetical protein